MGDNVPFHQIKAKFDIRNSKERFVASSIRDHIGIHSSAIIHQEAQFLSISLLTLLAHLPPRHASSSPS